MRYLVFVSATLALAACAPAGEGEDDTPSVPLGFELASAKEAQPGANTQIVELDVATLQARLAAGNVRLIDVRTDEEVAEGMIPGAEHIALSSFDPAALDLSDGREVILYCRSGNRSGKAAAQLAAHTGKPAEHLAGGITGWLAAGNAVK